MRSCPVLAALAVLLAQAARAEEVCRYSGTTDYSGHAVVETRAAPTPDGVKVDVTANVTARELGLLDRRYLYQEIGIWRGGELREIGVNHRYSVLGVMRRQQWDLFHREQAGLQAWRLQANSRGDLEKKFPSFAAHWDPASFGQPWLTDYVAAGPERRTDLDLPADRMTRDLGTPLQMGFYWIRWAGVRDRTVPLFLPGFKHDPRVDVSVSPIGDAPPGLVHLRSTVRYARLSETRVSIGDAWISNDHHLQRVTFDARTDRTSAHGELRLDACQGEPPAQE
jgi:hypothetical protein